MAWAEGFPPIAAPDARVLVLGSMPGQASLAAGQYYAHPRNAFWPIMGALAGAGPELPYPERVARLQAAGVAVWDVLAACHRPGSLDSAIRLEDAELVDLPGFLDAHPGVRRLYFNGGTAATLFRRRMQPLLAERPLTLATLPSTSPAHAGLPFAEKLARWRRLLD
jgi:TDG/mug DNA glycosylase family protein